jgi:hypothetical protein
MNPSTVSLRVRTGTGLSRLRGPNRGHLRGRAEPRGLR